eukprot:UN29526
MKNKQFDEYTANHGCPPILEEKYNNLGHSILAVSRFKLHIQANDMVWEYVFQYMYHCEKCRLRALVDLMDRITTTPYPLYFVSLMWVGGFAIGMMFMMEMLHGYIFCAVLLLCSLTPVVLMCGFIHRPLFRKIFRDVGYLHVVGIVTVYCVVFNILLMDMRIINIWCVVFPSSLLMISQDALNIHIRRYLRKYMSGFMTLQFGFYQYATLKSGSVHIHEQVLL